MTTQYDVIIVGGGLVGASLALTLEPLGCSVALVEPNPLPALPREGEWDARIYSFSPGSVDLLEACGAWRGVPPERAVRVERMEIYGDDVTSSLTFNAYDAGVRELAWIAENSLVHHALWNRVRESAAIRVYAEASCLHFSWEGDSIRLALDNGEDLDAELIVGADGSDSWVREQAGIISVRRSYGETGVVANFATMRPHRGVAYQWFGRNGVLALLPLPGERVSMVWSVPDAYAETLMALSPTELADAVAEASGYALGSLEVITPPRGFPLAVRRVARLVGAHIALVGDAAHNVHPLAGQGVNLGFRDVRALAQTLSTRGARTSAGDFRLLRRYERARAEDIATMRLVTDGLQKLFRVDAVWLARLRNAGLNAVDRLAPLKNLLIQHAVA